MKMKNKINFRSPPNWLIALALIVLAGAYSYSLFTGNPIYFWGKEFGVKRLAENGNSRSVSDTWDIRGEDLLGKWDGKWQVTTDTVGFPCDKRTDSFKWPGNCSAIFFGDRVFIRKHEAFLGGECFYFGTIKGNTVEGHYVCDVGQAKLWEATIRR